MMKSENIINLKDLKMPNTLPEMIDVYKAFKHIIFENWCVLHYKDSFREKNYFLQQIKQCAANNHHVKVCIGAVVLANYSQTFRDDCSNLLKEIPPPKENIASQFISIYIAKHANRFRTSSQFIVEILSVIQELLHPSKNKINHIHGKNLLYSLAVYATRALDKCTSRFYDVLLMAFCNPAPEIKTAALKTLNKYFELTRQKQHPQSLYVQARTLINLPNPKKQGGILILTSLIDFFPDYYMESDLAAFYWDQAMESIKKDYKLTSASNISCYMLQIALASNFPDAYRANILAIIKQIWPMDSNKPLPEIISLISFTLHKFSEAILPRIEQLLQLIGSLLSISDNLMIEYGSNLIIEFMNHLPNEFDKHAYEISRILLSAHYTNDFVDIFQTIITRHDSVWKYLYPNLGQLLVQLLDERKSNIALRLIPILPSIPENYVQMLTERVQTLLSETDLNLRKLVPPALLVLNNLLPSSRSLHTGSALIASAMIDESWEMRLAILESFKPPYPPFLAYPNILEHFSVLVNDESYKVRRAALRILGGVSSLNPAMIYPMFRRILLDILFLIGSSKSMRVQSDATLCLPIIFSNVIPILPIYVPVFLPIALQYLKGHLSAAANEIDDPHNFKTTPSYPTQVLSYGSTSSISRTPYLMSLSTSFDAKTPVMRSGSLASMASINESVIPRAIVEEQMTFFERIFSTKIAVNFIQSIGCICENSFDLIKPSVNEITTLLLETIGRAAHKTILLASIDTLGKIVDQLGPAEAVKIPDLNSTLLKLGSRLISAKVYTAIFRMLGRIGPIAPQSSLNMVISEVKAPENVDLSLPREDYFVRAVVTSLFFVLDDKSESALYSDAHRALSRTFSTCSKSVNSQRLFKSYVARLLTTIRALAADERSLYFQYIATILRCPMEWLQPFAGHFFKLIEDLWDSENNADVLMIIPKLASALKDEFSPYMPRVVSFLLDALASCASSSSNHHDDSRPQLILRTLAELSKFATNFIFIIIRQISETITQPKISHTTVSYAMSSIRSLVQNYNCSPYSSLIVRTCLYVVNANPNQRFSVLQVLYSLAVTMGTNFKNYIQALQMNDLMTKEMIEITSSRKRRYLHEYPFILVDKFQEEKTEWHPKTEIDENELTSATDIPFLNGTSEQWKSWIRTFIQSFIKHSPIAAIQSCIPIAEKSTLFNRKIFNPAFLSCWAQLSSQSQTSIQASISRALAPETSTPSSVVTALIGLVEFADRARMPIEGNIFNRTKAALNAGKRTFALHCAQMDFYYNPNHSALNLDLLNQIYSQLGMFDEAKGIEKVAGGLKPNIEKLESKLARYELSGQWNSIADQFDIFSSLPETEKRLTGLTFAHAFLHLKDWTKFDAAIAPCRDTPNAIILRCLHDLLIGKDVTNLIQEGFVKLGQQGGPLFLHGFTAVAPYIVNAQQLVEIQEFSQNRTKLWEERLSTLNCHFNTIRPLLHTRMDILHASKETSFPVKLSFLKLARKANEWESFENFFNHHFLPTSPEVQVKYEYLHLLKKKGDEVEVLRFLDDVVKQPPKEDERHVYAKFFFKKAKWIARENNDECSVTEQMNKVIELCNKSINIRPQHYHAKNLWAWANMRLFDMKLIDQSSHINAAVAAITGFASCVKLDYQNTFFDMLQMISILFRSTNLPTVFERCFTSVNSIELKRFIKVIPQLLVYQYSHSEPHREFVRKILSELLTQYPNAVIFPLLFVKNFGKDNIGVAEILTTFQTTNSGFYDTAVKILNGLQNVCVTLPEFFSEGINNIYSDVSHERYDELEKSIPMFINRLQNIDTSRPYELAFVEKHKERLANVIVVLKHYLKTKQLQTIVMRKNDWSKFLKLVKQDMNEGVRLSIKSVAPELSNLSDNPGQQLAVFNTFDPDKPVVAISKFCDVVGIKMTKQRPRKLKLIGSDGKTYKYLLKGHEDLRLDQRMMQFFELMNSLSSSSMPHIIITGVTPLTPNVGLIQWVPSCDTMNALILEIRRIDHREHPDIECRMLVEETGKEFVDSLRAIQRLEFLEDIAATTPSIDLRDIMWLKAQDAESWVRQSYNFAKTSALMSIVGYVIGLGDRHPANIMIQRYTGTVIHIDYGDCFEVTKERAQLAETIPFRLTRMMITALGPCGVEGSFRRTCEETAQTIREHREAVMSILEIFIREPCSSGAFFDNPSETDVISGSVGIDQWMNETKGQKRLKKIISRISKKVNGLDFENEVPLTVAEQVDKLICQATDMYNLAHLYHGWNPLW